MDKQPSIIIIDNTKCLPCETIVCAGVCPVGIIEQNKNEKPKITDHSSCTKCGVCINLCPTKAITLETISQIEEK